MKLIRGLINSHLIAYIQHRWEKQLRRRIPAPEKYRMELEFIHDELCTRLCDLIGEVYVTEALGLDAQELKAERDQIDRTVDRLHPIMPK